MPPIKVSGQGKIEQAEVRVDGVEFEKEPDKITRPAEGDKTTDRGGVGGSDRDDDDNVPSVADINITTDPVDVSSLPNSAVVTVTLSTSTSGASIYYTLDGTTPTKDSELYEGHFTVTAPGQEGGTVTIKAIGVKEGYNGCGYGSLLLNKMVQNPWECCKKPISQNRGKYVITTIARGRAVNFYQRHGFKPCDFEQIPLEYRYQCSDCPEKEDCGPVPMILIGG